MSEKKTSSPIDDGPAIEPEVVAQGGAGALVATGASVIRIENETLMKVAIERERNLTQITKEAVGEIQAFPEEVDAYFYAIPYKDRRTGETTWVKGASVGLARMLPRLYGGVDVKSRIVEQTDDYAKVEGIAVDMQKVVRFSSELSCTRTQRKRDGSTYQLSIDKWQQMIAATLAKAERNAALKIMPRALVQKCFNLAMELAAKQGSDAKKVAAMVTAFAALKPPINEEVLCFFAGVESIRDISPDGFSHLRGMYAGLKSGEVKVQEILDQYTAALTADPTRDTLTGSADATGTIGEGPRPGDEVPPPPAA